MASAFVAGLVHWHVLGRRTGTRDAAFAGDLAFWLMIGGIVGARIAYVIANYNTQFRNDPLAMLRVDQGGLIFYGGFAGAALAVILFARWRHEPVLALGDFAITALPLGHALGRVGCFLNDCCRGRLADAPGLLTLGCARYPVQLYESALNLAVYAFLFRFYLRHRTPRGGAVVAAYLCTYPVGRFLLEFLRGDERERLGMLSVAQYLSLALLATGIVLGAIVRRQHENASRTA
jgi:phosphatidylglycerol:prolipoprotein diacylglycerol transferase